MRSNSSTENSEFKSVVDHLLLSVRNYDRVEYRSAIREPLVVPVRATFTEDGFEMPGFTRNISASGVGLLLPASCKQGSYAVIQLERADGYGKYRVLSECRWVKAFGEQWYLSGWLFISVQNGG